MWQTTKIFLKIIEHSRKQERSKSVEHFVLMSSQGKGEEVMLTKQTRLLEEREERRKAAALKQRPGRCGPQSAQLSSLNCSPSAAVAQTAGGSASALHFPLHAIRTAKLPNFVADV